MSEDDGDETSMNVSARSKCSCVWGTNTMLCDVVSACPLLASVMDNIHAEFHSRLLIPTIVSM